MWWKFIKRVCYCTFSLGKTNTHNDLFVIVYGLLRYFKQNSCDVGLPNLTGPLTAFHLTHKLWNPCMLSPIKNPHDMYVCNSLSNVPIHMLYVNIHHTGIINWKWFLHVHTYLRLQWVHTARVWLHLAISVVYT